MQLITIKFNLVIFFYSTKSQQHSPQITLYGKVKTLQQYRENPNSQTSLSRGSLRSYIVVLKAQSCSLWLCKRKQVLVSILNWKIQYLVPKL